MTRRYALALAGAALLAGLVTYGVLLVTYGVLLALAYLEDAACRTEATS